MQCTYKADVSKCCCCCFLFLLWLRVVVCGRNENVNVIVSVNVHIPNEERLSDVNCSKKRFPFIDSAGMLTVSFRLRFAIVFVSVRLVLLTRTVCVFFLKKRSIFLFVFLVSLSSFHRFVLSFVGPGEELFYVTMAKDNISAKFLIHLIGERPALWDKTSDEYRDRSLKETSWREICTFVNENFQRMSPRAKEEFSE